MDDIKLVAAIMAAARLAKETDQTPELAARYFTECFAMLERTEFQFPRNDSAPDDIMDDDVDPTRLNAR